MMRSIKAKLIAIIGLTTAVTLCVAFAIVIVSDVRTYRGETVESTLLIAKVVSEYSVSDLVFNDHDAAAETLAKLKGIPTVTYASLFDSTGRELATYGSLMPGETRTVDQARAVALGEGALEVIEPVVYQDEQFGTLYLRVSTHGLNAKITRRVLTLSGLLIALVAVVLLVTTLLQRIISRPILDLAAATRKISETGNYSIRVPNRDGDEIGVLCEGFNEMLDQIQLRQLERDEAVHRTREKSHFLAAMSHELRTPLNSIIGFSEILLRRTRKTLEPKAQSFLENIHASGQHLLGIINDILDLSKVEAGKMEIRPEPVSVQSIINGVVTVMRGVSQKREVEIRVEGLNDLPVIEADPIKLKQVFFNLISNAVKFSVKGSIVRVSARSLPASTSPLEENSVEIAFIDRGIGIDERDFEKIFQPFRQADSGIARQFGGTGLGLALVRNFVKKHGGKVLLESKRGEGSTFTVLLPVSRGESEFTVGDSVEEFASLHARDRIVVVEDDAETLERIHEHLISAGFEVVAATSGEQAIELIRKVKPAAIVLDIILPGLDGWAVLKEIKMHRATAGIPVVMCSELRNEELAVALGADDYFLKPLGMEKLAARVKRLLGGDEAPARHLLIIDDDPMVHDLLESRLVPMGFRLDHAHSGEEGVAAAEDDPPDLIVLDLMMDGMDGFEVAIKLRSIKATADIPIVVLTAADLSEDEHRRLYTKITAFIRKGEDERHSLVTVIRRLLARQQRTRPVEKPAGDAFSGPPPSV